MVTDCKAGQVYLLDYTAMGLNVPEMVKERLVVVVSPRNLDGRRGCATVVPLSTSPPKQPVPHNVPLSKEYQWVRGRPQLWAKCDMIYTPALDRLQHVDRPDLGQDPERNYRPVPTLSRADLKNIRFGVAHVVGLDDYLVPEQRTGFRAEMRQRIMSLLKRKGPARKPAQPKTPTPDDGQIN